MASLAAISDAITTRLATITGLRVFAWPPAGSTPPVGFVQVAEWEPTAFTRAGQKTYRFEVYVLTAESVRPQDGYRALLEYADSSGAKSVELAIWDGNNPSTGQFVTLANTFAAVKGFRILGAEDVDAIQMYGGVFAVEVLTKS